ncbi:gluconolactonase [Opitutaceae bacterium TAV5]|nr:gluconolactonase [Opitutaceae bacterium TAV5]
MNHRVFSLSLALAIAAVPAFSASAELVEVARSPEHMWNGVTVSKTGRLFASFPAMAGARTLSVGEILPDGAIRPYPGGTWNTYEKGDPTHDRFVGVNAVVSDDRDRLWVVDPAGGFGSVPLAGQAKLVQIDLAADTVARVYPFPTDVVPERGFINDVRIAGGHAILTDSGLGALIVLDLDTGRSRRLLADDPRLKADPNLTLTIDGRPYLNAQGRTPQMHVNTLDLSPDGRHLYFQPNGGPRLLRLPLALLIDPAQDDTALSAAIEDLGPTRFNAGMTFGPDGSLYYSDIEIGGITRRKPDGTFETLVADPARIAWPDASRIGPDGFLYFPAAQINRLPANNPEGRDLIERPFLLFKVRLP